MNLDCTTIPVVKGKYGNKVNSELYTTLMEFTNDRDLLNNIYKATKTDQFKMWFPMVDWNDEPIISYVDGEPIFMNYNHEYQYIFPRGTKYKMISANEIFAHLQKLNMLTKYNNLIDPLMNPLEEQKLKGKMKPETEKAYTKVAEINQKYKELYNLHDDLVYTKKIGKVYKVFVNPNAIKRINEIRSNRMKVRMSPNYTVLDESFDYAEQILIARKGKVEDLTQAIGKFINFKEKAIKDLSNKIKFIKTSLKQQGLSLEDKKILESRRLHYNNILYGDSENIGLIKEVEELKDFVDRRGKFVSFSDLNIFAMSSIDRMNQLINSKDINDINEASEIAEFFKAAGSLTPDNPVITPIEQVLLSDEDKLVIAQWRNFAESVAEIINTKKKDSVIGLISNIPSIKKMYSGKLSEEGIRKLIGEDGLRDINIIDMYFMDASNGIFSQNGILPQVMKMELENAKNRSKSVIKSFENRLSKLLPDVEKYLASADGGKYKFKLGTSVSWEMFFQRNSEGFKTGKLINRFSQNWDRAVSILEHKYREQLFAADNESVIDGTYINISNKLKAKENRRQWYRNNSDVFNFMGVEEIIKYISDHPVLSTMNFPVKEKFLTAEDIGISELHFKDLIEEQKILLNDYANNFKLAEDRFTTDGIINDVKLNQWVLENSPYYGFRMLVEPDVKFGNEFKGKSSKGQDILIYNNYEFNVKIPKKSINNKDSGYWDSNFDIFESNESLYEMRNLAEEIFDYINDTLPYKEDSMILNKKNLYEILFDNSDSAFIARLSEAWKYIIDTIIDSLSINETSINANIDKDINNVEISKVNNQIILNNKKLINRKFAAEELKFISMMSNNFNERKITSYTELPVNQLTNNAISYLANKLNVEPNIEAIKNKLNITSDSIPVGKILKNSVINEVIEESSYNLPRTLMSFMCVASEYNARQEVKPIIDNLLEYYKSIKAIKTNNVNVPFIDSVYTGERNFAIKQINDWYNRSVLGSYEGKQFGKIRRILTPEEKELEKELLLRLDSVSGNEELASDIRKNISELGRDVYTSKVLQAMLNFIRLKYLGWNLSSATTNLLEGQIANEIIGAQGDHFSASNWYRATGVLGDMIVNKKSRDAKLTAILMNRYDVLFDSKNEFQKQASKTPLTKLSRFAPYELNTSVEYLNQSPLMIAMLMEHKIKDVNGENEISLWDAFDKEGNIKEEYRTDENVNNWENLQGDSYESFKHNLIKLIVNTHGDYDLLRGMMAKSNLFGKSFMMFKTWFSRAVYNRMAIEQDDIELGVKGYKGRYRSHNSISAGLHGAVVGAGLAGPVGAAVGFGAGVFLGGLNHNNHSFVGGSNNNTLVNHLQELGLYVKIMGKRLAGIPINRVLKSDVMGLDDITKELTDSGFSERDAKNLQSNLVEIGITATFIALIMIAKAALWDDDDEEDAARRQMHNLLVNRLMTLTSQSSMYVNLPEMKESITNVALLKFAGDITTISSDVQKFFENDDILKTGPNKGKSRLLKDMKKTFLPATFRGDITLGFESQLQRQFTPSPYDKWFWSKERKDELIRKNERAVLKRELEENGYSPEVAQKIVDNRLPTLKQMKRKREL